MVAHDRVGFDVDAALTMLSAEGVGAVVGDEVAAVVELAASWVVEAEVAVGAAADAVAAFVDQFVVEPAQQQKVFEGGGALVTAVADVMGVDPPRAAAGETALAIAQAEGPT